MSKSRNIADLGSNDVLETSADGIAVTGEITATDLTVTNTITGSVSDISNHDTDDLTEGTTNQYFTEARVLAALSASDGITFNSGTGEFTLTDSGVTANTYGSASEVPVLTIDANGRVTAATTTNVAGVSTFTYDSVNETLTITTADGGSFSVDVSSLASESFVNTIVSNLVDSAPTTLDTLNELAAAINDDANFAATVTTALGTKVDKINITGATVGSSTAIPVITYNTQGQITSASETGITVGDGQFTITAGAGLADGGVLGTANQTGNTSVTISHADTSTQASVNNSGNTFVQDITLDGFGHITGIASGTVTVGDATITVAAGTDLSTGGDFTTNQGTNETITIDHSAISRTDTTSSQTATHSGTVTVVDGVTTSATGHVTAVNVKTVTLPAGAVPNNATITISAGTDLSTGGDFTTDQGTNETITLNHANITRTDTTSTASPAHGGTFTVVDGITSNARGHITAANVKTVTLPAQYVHPTHAGDDIDLDTGALAGGTVISDLDFNITTDTSGHVTDANATYSTKNLDDRYYTETESDARFVNVTGDTITGSLTIDGDLTVGGTTTTVNAENLAISDNMVYLNDGNSTENIDLGWAGNYNDGTYAHTGFFRDASDGRFKVFDGYTPEPDAAVNIDTTHASFNLADIQAGTFYGALSGNASTASSAAKWTTARTLSLTGAVTGSASIDGSGNVSISTTATSDPTLTINGDASGSATFTNLGNATLTLAINNDSHDHSRLLAVDDRDVKPSATGIGSSIKGIRAFFTSLGGMTGTANTDYQDMLALDTYSDSSGGGPNAITMDKSQSAGDPIMRIWKGDWAGSTWGTGQRVFADNYHPNADKWTTARTLSLTGAVTGSASIDGSGNVSIATTATSDPTLTLNGDVSGSATFTNLGNATLTVTVADDSHNHVISNVDGLQAALDGKAPSSHTHSYLSSGSDSEQSAHFGDVQWNQGAVRINSDPRNNESGYDSDLSAIHWWSTTATGANYGRVGHALYNGSAYQYLTTKSGQNNLYVNNNAIFHESYHPNADKWTTARTLSLSGDASGSVSWDGSANATLSVTVNNNSHNHDTLDYDLLTGPATSSRDKIRLYSSSSYAIGMQSGITYGGLNDWAMTFQFNNETDRGFWWGHEGHTTAQGAMSLTTAGHLTVGSRIDVPIMYDSNDTGYYADPAGDTRLNNLRLQGGVCNPTLSAYYYDAALEVREYNFGGSQTDSWSYAPRIGLHWGGRVASQIALASNGRVHILNNPGTDNEDLQCDNFYATNMYDRNNTGYYCDPASTSNFNALNVGGYPVLTTNSTITVSGYLPLSGGTITGDLTVQGTLYETSDASIKENVQSIEGALDKVTKLRGVSFNKIGFSHTELGFIAQEVEPVVPELVVGDEDGIKKVSYSRTVALLVEANKELNNKLESQQNEIDELKELVKQLLNK